MSSSFSGIHMASSALRAFQSSMEVVGHNLSNVNTPGYSRQTVDFKANPPMYEWDHGIRTIGQGVSLGQISRVRDEYLERTRNGNSADLGKSSTLAGGLSRIDNIFGEPSDSGISSALGKVYDAFSGLAADPSSAGARSQVRTAAQTLTDRVKTMWGDLQEMGQATTAQIDATLQQVQTLGAKIADLNKQISATTFGHQPNDLLDQRDQAINELSQLVDVNVNRDNRNNLNVSVGGFTLVNGSEVTEFPKSYNPETGTINNGTDSFAIRGGVLAGQLETLNNVNQYKAKLDTFADELRSEFNRLHSAGTNGFGNTGVNLFNAPSSPGEAGAHLFDLSAEVKADPRAISAGISDKPSDGGLAQQMADLRTAKFASLGDQTFTEYFQGAMSKLASDASYHDNLETTHRAIGTQIENQIQSVSGVSMDEEMANMLKLQRSYEASAKVLSVFDSILQETINMVNR